MADERDQSMEDILASIKKVMEEEPVPAPRAARVRRAPADEVLELADVAEEEGSSLVSARAAGASRARLAELAAAKSQTLPVSDAPLEALVREMLKPILKDWLDRHLPEIVEELVQREIQRISGKPV